MVDQRNFGDEKYYLVRFFENVVFIPSWMTDADHCKACVLQHQPQCSLNALLDLHHLLESIPY